MILGYTRVSTQEQVNGTSPEEQERAVRGFAMMQGADQYSVLIFADPAVSGATPLDQRPAGKDLLLNVHRGDTVVASKLDRLFRSALDALQVAENFKRKGIKLVLLDMGSTPVTEGGMAACFFAMAAAFAQLERERISERMQDGRAAKRRKGGHIGGAAPFGFRVVGAGKEALLEPVPDEQVVLDECRVFARQGRSPHRAAKTLNRRGFRTRNGKPFHCAQVQRIMQRSLHDASVGGVSG